MKCPVCKHPLVKVSTRTTITGGKKRRNPVYAKCPRLNDPAFHPARAKADQPKAADGAKDSRRPRPLLTRGSKD